MKAKWNTIISIILAAVFYVSGDTVEISWIAPEGYTVDHYQVQVIRETGETSTYTTANTTYTVSRIGAGRYRVEISAFDGSGNQSGPCSSLDQTCALLKTMSSGIWEIQWNPTAPGTITHTP